jgi:iron complex outermembrane receptor protein
LKYQAGTDRVILLSGVSTLGYFNQYDLDSLAQEIRLTSKLSGSTQWTAGAYFKDSRENQIQNAVPTFPDLYDIDIRSKSAAVFGEVTQALGDRFELTGGLRYFHDDQLNTQASNFFPGALAPAATATFDHVTGRLVAKYTIDKDEIIYGSVSTGFRSGLNQAAAVISVDPAFPPLKPDSLVTYEVGNKANAFDGRLSYDLAAYFTDWKNTQQSLVLPVGFAAYVNAGNASGFGVDASAQYQATQNLALHASVGWNGLTFANNVQQTGTILFAKGERLNESPAVTAQIASDSHFPIGLPTVDGTLGGHLNYDSSQVNRFLAGSLLTETTSANIFSAGGELGVAAQRWSAELFAENIFNNREAVTPPDVTVDFQSIRLRPRTVGLRANTKF